MDTSFNAGIEAYRTEAAKRFRTTCASNQTSSAETEFVASSSPGQHSTYQRAKIPGLEQYLRKAAVAYANAKTPEIAKQPCVARALGHGLPVEHLHVAERRERWLRLRAERKHFVSVMHQVPRTDFVHPCGIPTDVLNRAASRFLLCKNGATENSLKQKPPENVLGRPSVDTETTVEHGIQEDPGYSMHIKRCEDGLEAGEKALFRRNENMHARCDTFEEIRGKYAGKPDEVYRRKTARRYASWRRRQREEAQILRERELHAEREMKRRRGHDQLLTSRASGDSSLAPFLYELSNNTYAYSSKITEAPKLRKIMIDKYTSRTFEKAPEPSQWQKAQLVAETNPLFHTRVMNRFS